MASAESRAFKSQFSTLLSVIDNPLTIAAEAYSGDLISRDVMDKMLVSTLTAKEKAAILLTSVESHIATNQQSFHEFVRVLKTQTNLVQTAENLQMDYWKYQGEHISTTANLESSMPPLSQPTVKRMKLDDSQDQIQGSMSTVSQLVVKRMRLDDRQVQTQGNPVQALAESVRTIYSNRPVVNADCWPPVKKSHYINLALIENERMDLGNEFSCYTLRGSVDDIMRNKDQISYSCIFENMNVGARILLEGRPGSGKTTLMNKISRDWATGAILNSLVSLLILVPLRQLASTAQVTLETLLSFIPDNKAQQLGHHIHNIAGEGICFALDGLDEYSITKGRSDFIFELIRRSCLPRSIVIVASRPAASQRFRRYADQSIEVLGFLRTQIEQFILEYYAPNEELAKELQLYLDHHPNVLHMCYLPVHAAIVTFLFSKLGAKLPETETEIYKQFTLQTLIRTQLKAEDTNVTLESFEDLTPEQYQLFCGICELALNATVDQKQAFTHKEVKCLLTLESGCETNESLGLITVDRQLMLYGPTNTYSFLHLTFQEFLAACHLTTLDNEKQYELVSSYRHKAHMHVVCKFLCGLTQLKSECDLKCFQSIISGAPPCTLLHLHCTYESQSEIACQTLVSICNGVLHLKKEYLNPSDSSAIAFIIANTGVMLHEANLDSCHIGQESLETLAKLDHSDLCNLKNLSLSGTKISDPTAAKSLVCFMEKAEELYLLKLDRCGLQMKTFLEVAPSLSKLTHLEVLSIHHNSQAVKCGECLRDALKSMLQLKELDIDVDVLKMFGVYELYKHCKSLKTVRVWRKQLFAEVSVSSSDEAVIRLYDVILEGGYLSLHDLGAVLQNSSFSKLQFKREISADRKTESLDGVKIDPSYSRHSRLKPQDFGTMQAFAGPGLVHLSSLLKAFTDTTVLNLACNKIWDEGLSILARGLKVCQNLNNLNLDCNGIGQEGCSALTAALQQCKQLQVLSLRWNEIDDKGVSILVNGLKECQSLKELNLDRNNIGDAGCAALSTALQECKELQQLDLDNNNIGDAGCTSLSTALQECKELQRLDLGGNGIGQEGCSALTAALQQCKQLQVLRLACNKIWDEGLSRGLKACQNLNKLNLSWNEIGEKGVSILVNGLKECQSLKELNLNHNNIRDEGCAALSAALQECKELQQLKAGGNKVGDEGLSILANGLKECQNLKYLYLQNNNLTDASIEPLTKMFKTAKSLTYLWLWDNNFTPDGKKQLRQAAEERKSYPDFVELHLYL